MPPKKSVTTLRKVLLEKRVASRKKKYYIPKIFMFFMQNMLVKKGERKNMYVFVSKVHYPIHSWSQYHHVLTIATNFPAAISSNVWANKVSFSEERPERIKVFHPHSLSLSLFPLRTCMCISSTTALNFRPARRKLFYPLCSLLDYNFFLRARSPNYRKSLLLQSIWLK